MGAERDAMCPLCVCGVRPAISSNGTLSRAAFISAQTVLPVPTVTWTITAAGLPATW
ncbi:hypothetical protein D3C83_206600 [compost metagenome]